MDLKTAFSNSQKATTENGWYPVFHNYPQVNAALEEKDSASVLNWYRKLNVLREENEY